LIADNLASVTHHIGEAARKAGRDPDSIHLIVVSKQVSSEKIIEAYQAGSKYFGENKVQEAVSKIDEFPKSMKLMLRMLVGILSGTCKKIRSDTSIPNSI